LSSEEGPEAIKQVNKNNTDEILSMLDRKNSVTIIPTALKWANTVYTCVTESL